MSPCQMGPSHCGFNKTRFFFDHRTTTDYPTNHQAQRLGLGIGHLIGLGIGHLIGLGIGHLINWDRSPASPFKRPLHIAISQ